MPINEKQTENKSSSSSTQPYSKTERPVGSSMKWSEVDEARADVKETFGLIPTFLNNFTDQSMPGAWNEVKNLRFGSNTALDLKLKSLIGLAVATQIPCDRISYYDQKSSLTEGASQQEQLEAVLMAGLTRHWSTVLNGLQIDQDEFRKEVDKVMTHVKKMMEESRGKMPTEEMFLIKPTTPEETYKDIEKTLGIVPKFFRNFAKEGIAGAWSTFKGLQLNPFTSLSGKEKELIGLAVSAQIPCSYCVYFHRNAATLNGASEREMQEAVSIAALARQWSTVFHGPQIDLESFKKDADSMMERSPERSH